MALDVHMHGERVGTLRREDGAYGFAYDMEAVERLGTGRSRLSTRMVPRAEPYGPEIAVPYVEGLLPQGRRRLRLSRELGLEAGDGYGLIAAIGRDCIGAVGFLPRGEGQPPPSRPGEPAWIGAEELAEVLRTPPERLFDPECPQRMRAALPGRRHKIALVRDEESGRWAWPHPGAPSTHIVKPEPPYRPGIAALEAACTLAYREVGLMACHAEPVEIAGVECLVSKRFDRWQADDGTIECIHQESLAQALGIRPGAQEGRLVAGAPTLAEVAGLLRAIGEEGAVDALLTAAFCDLLIGHTEPRGGGAALLFAGGSPSLAPFHDLVATEIYGDERPRPTVIGPDVPPAPLLVDLVHTLRQCGAEEEQPALLKGIGLMRPLGSALSAAAQPAVDEGWYRRSIDDTLQRLMQRSIKFFKEEAGYLRPPE